MYCNKKFIVLSLIYMFTKEDMKSEDYIYSLHYSLLYGGQKMKWVNLSNAIAYIENNLDGEISFDTAAKIACCSTNYFQRIFSYVAGISVSEYIRHRRMTQAAFELQSSNIKVLDLALKYGYTSPTSFNRAFQRVHGVSPILAKSQSSNLNAYPPIKFSIQVSGASAMPYRIEEKQAMRIVGIRIPITNEMEENQKRIPIFWEKVLKSEKFSELCSLSNQSPQGILGLGVYENLQKFYYYIAVATNKAIKGKEIAGKEIKNKAIKEDLFAHEIPSSTWVVFENNGNFKESVQTTFKRFFTEWLPFSGYTHRELPEMEVYPLLDASIRHGHCEMWLAIKKETE